MPNPCEESVAMADSLFAINDLAGAHALYLKAMDLAGIVDDVLSIALKIERIEKAINAQEFFDQNTPVASGLFRS